jgi:hypothetical protein
MIASLEEEYLEKEIMQRGGRAWPGNCRVCPELFPFPFFPPEREGEGREIRRVAGADRENRLRSISR